MKIYGALSYTALQTEIKGTFHILGPIQPPDWVVEAFKKDHSINQIVIERESSGAIYTRIKEG
jgi:hypothetical protein